MPDTNDTSENHEPEPRRSWAHNVVATSTTDTARKAMASHPIDVIRRTLSAVNACPRALEFDRRIASRRPRPIENTVPSGIAI